MEEGRNWRGVRRLTVKIYVEGSKNPN